MTIELIHQAEELAGKRAFIMVKIIFCNNFVLDVQPQTLKAHLIPSLALQASNRRILVLGQSIDLANGKLYLLKNYTQRKC